MTNIFSVLVQTNDETLTSKRLPDRSIWNQYQ